MVHLVISHRSNYSNHFRVLILILSIFGLLFISPVHAWNPTVVSVEDGDTFSVNSAGHTLKIRIFGVDCPEKYAFMADEATSFTRSKLLGKKVNLTPVDIDRYDRIVAWVNIDGVNFNRLLIEKGLAWHYTKYSDDTELKEAEQIARSRMVGVWGKGSQKPGHLSDKQATTGTSSAYGVKSNTATTVRGAVYHGNRRSRKFHRSSCRHYNCKNCTAIFHSRDEAIDAGYVPAGCCKP